MSLLDSSKSNLKLIRYIFTIVVAVELVCTYSYVVMSMLIMFHRICVMALLQRL